MTRVTEEQLADLDRLHSEATPGPWATECQGVGDWPITGAGDYLCVSPDDGVRGGHEKTEAELIVAMRNALPDLLATVREQAAEIERLQATVQRIRDLAREHEDEEHNEGCEGEPECAACWVQSIRAALDGGE